MIDLPPPDEASSAGENYEAWATWIDWERIGKSKVFWVAVAAAATISILFWTTNNAVFIDPFIIPPSLAKTGLSSEGLAAQVGDVLSKLETATRASYLRRDLVSPGDDTMAPDVVIPGTGVSVKAIAGVLRSLFATHVTGVLVLARAEGTSPNATMTILITRRAHPAPAAQFSQRVENIDALSAMEIDTLVKGTAKEILHQLNPLLFAACLGTNGELESAIQVARHQVAVQTGNEHMMAAAYDVWGDALQKHVEYDEAAQCPVKCPTATVVAGSISMCSHCYACIGALAKTHCQGWLTSSTEVLRRKPQFH